MCRLEEVGDEKRILFQVASTKLVLLLIFLVRRRLEGGGDVKKYSIPSNSHYQVGTFAHLSSPRWLTMMRTATTLENLLSSLVKRFEELAAKAPSPIT